MRDRVSSRLIGRWKVHITGSTLGVTCFIHISAVLSVICLESGCIFEATKVSYRPTCKHNKNTIHNAAGLVDWSR